MKRINLLLVNAIFAVGLCSCSIEDNSGVQTHESTKTVGKTDAVIQTNPPGIFNITITGLSFAAPDQIPSGWTTFRVNNTSPMVHFAVVEKFPDGFGVAEQQQELAPLFQQGMDLLRQGDAEAAKAKFAELPEWFGRIVFFGGPGLTSGGGTSQTTLDLEPGTYVLECYVKTNGIFHSYNPVPGQYGMVHQFIVTRESSGAKEPKATVELTISSEAGIEAPDTIKTGAQTVAVHFLDQKTYANFVGHDVHLARLDEDTDLAKLENWMDWTRPHGLETPAPVTFLGGTNEMPAGNTAYVSVTFTPGRYAWIAEVPNSRDKGMLKIFEVVR